MVDGKQASGGRTTAAPVSGGGRANREAAGKAKTAIKGVATPQFTVVLKADLVGAPRRSVIDVAPFAGVDADRRAEVTNVSFADARLHNSHFHRARILEASFLDADVWSWGGPNLTAAIGGLRINGIDVAPLVEAEMDRTHPERALLRGVDEPDGVRLAWRTVGEMWIPAVERARALPESDLHEQVEGEWSFLETLRHLVGTIDGYVGAAILGRRPPAKPVPLGSAAWRRRPPTLEEMLAARQERHELVEAFVGGLTAERLDGPCFAAGRTVRDVLTGVISEEWWHRLYALRDLEVLGGRRS